MKTWLKVVLIIPVVIVLLLAGAFLFLKYVWFNPPPLEIPPEYQVCQADDECMPMPVNCADTQSEPINTDFLLEFSMMKKEYCEGRTRLGGETYSCPVQCIEQRCTFVC